MIKKAVIPCAGLGTRFLPFTKAMPKELIPIVDTPVLQLIVEEVVASGIEEILIIDNCHKKAIEKHFSEDARLENLLQERNQEKFYQVVKNLSSMCKFSFVEQNNPQGSAHAVSLAKDFAGGEDFALLFGDDLIFVGNDKPAIRQLIDAYEEFGHKTVLGVQPVLKENISKYGSIKIERTIGDVYEISDVIEKPEAKDAPSLIAALGRYVCTNEIFSFIEKTPKGVGGEYQITDSFQLMAKENKVIAKTYHGTRYDTGNKLSYLKACIDYGLRMEETKEIANYIVELGKSLEGKA